MNAKEKKTNEIELALLNKIQNGKNITQRSISKDLNVALGIANSLIKKFIKKGFLKFKHAPMKRYFYYLTPKGIVEKTKLTREYLKSSLQFYSNSRKEYEELLTVISKKKKKNLIFVGCSELTEIAILAARNISIEVNYIYSISFNRKIFCGIKVINNLKNNFNRENTLFLLTELNEPKILFDAINKDYEIFKPNFLLIDEK